jgi:predicted nucleic-acid-binding Zn-ribbon protein
MNAKTTCPKCHSEFNYKENMTSRVYGISSFFRQIEKKRFEPLIRRRSGYTDEVRSNLTVACPTCGNEFILDEYKFFGLFSPSGIKAILVVFFALFLFISIYVIIKDLF